MASNERAKALAALLALPDEPCLHRGYHYVLPRDTRVNADKMKRDLAMAYVEWRRYDHVGGEISCVVLGARARLKVVSK